jgi:hypothetical protein
MESQKKELKLFKLIEIDTEKEVRDVLEFYHPVYPGSQQEFYFDTNANFMLEMLTAPKVSIYKKNQKPGKVECKWEFVRRIEKYPYFLENNSGFLRAMSPCFSRYLDLNKEQKMFVVKDTFT